MTLSVRSEKVLKPRVSIVMTSYNYEKYIGEAIESVLGQTFRDFELIIVDDCSKDRSKAIIQEYANEDKRVRYLFHERNMGISPDTNDGLAMCKGDYIALLDSDDSWDKDKLKIQVNVLERKPNIYVVYSDARIIDENSTPVGIRFSQKWPMRSFSIPSLIAILARGLPNIAKYLEAEESRSGNIFKNLLRDNWICKSSAIFRRCCIKDATFNEEVKLDNDWVFWIDLARKNEFYYICKPLANYRSHGKNVSMVASSSELKKDSYLVSRMIRRKYYHLLPMCSKIRFMIYRKLLLANNLIHILLEKQEARANTTMSIH